MSVTVLDHLPDPSCLERAGRASAVLDAVLCPEWELRYYSYDPAWDVPKGQRLVSMRDGSGDGWFLLVTPTWAALKGLAHERLSHCRSAGDLLGDLPEPLRADFGEEPAFTMSHATYLGWWDASSRSWTVRSGGEHDGAGEHLEVVLGGAEKYQVWAQEYHETSVDLGLVRKVFRGERLTRDEVSRLNPSADPDEVLLALVEIQGEDRRPDS
jgi:hypothetical protein